MTNKNIHTVTCSIVNKQWSPNAPFNPPPSPAAPCASTGHTAAQAITAMNSCRPIAVPRAQDEGIYQHLAVRQPADQVEPQVSTSGRKYGRHGTDSSKWAFAVRASLSFDDRRATYRQHPARRAAPAVAWISLLRDLGSPFVLYFTLRLWRAASVSTAPTTAQ
jgi:hypothetical protein